MKASRIHGMEWLLGLGGAVILAGPFFPWADGTSGFATFNFLVLLFVLIGVAALLVPPVVAASRLTDVPIAWETLLWLASLTLLLVVLVVLFLIPPSLSHGAGVWISLAGLVTVGLAGWRSVRREY